MVMALHLEALRIWPWLNYGKMECPPGHRWYSIFDFGWTCLSLIHWYTILGFSWTDGSCSRSKWQPWLGGFCTDSSGIPVDPFPGPVGLSHYHSCIGHLWIGLLHYAIPGAALEIHQEVSNGPNMVLHAVMVAPCKTFVAQAVYKLWWLLVSFQMQFKGLVITFKAPCGTDSG